LSSERDARRLLRSSCARETPPSSPASRSSSATIVSRRARSTTGSGPTSRSRWRADVEVEIVEADRLAVLAGLPLLLACRDDARQPPVAGQDLDALAEQHVRVEAAERADGELPIVARVRDDERDLVDVADDCEQRPARRAGDAHPRRAEHVGVNLSERACLLAPDGGSELFLPRRPGGGEETRETFRGGHGDDSNRAHPVDG
jgi:hypothetical protein